MEEQTELIDELIDKGHDYGKTTLNLMKLKALDKTSDVLSNLISWLPVFIAVTLFFLILNIGIAIWLGDLFGEMYYGFFTVAGFYAILTLICWGFRKSMIKNPLNDSIINQILGEEDL